MRPLATAAVLVAWLAAAPGAFAMIADGPAAESPGADARIAWRDARAVGLPDGGRLLRGVLLPAAGRDFWTYDWGLRRSPNRPGRRWGTDELVRVVLEVVARHRAAHPRAPRVGIADLSRRGGGRFGVEFGGLGHVSHQNGLDVDVLYPRRDGAELPPSSPALVDRALAQDLVDRFVAAGAVRIFTGWSLRLRGPRGVVEPLAHHDDHLHVRIRPAR